MGLNCCKLFSDDFAVPVEIPTRSATPVIVVRKQPPAPIQAPKKRIFKNDEMLMALMNQLGVPQKHYIPPGKPYVLERVHEDSSCSRFVRSSFGNSKFNHHYRITGIFRVWNPCLFLQYALVKARNGDKFKEWHLFHGTDSESLKGILTHNFDWRRIRNGRSGWGVSFANNPWFASHYSRKHRLRYEEDYIMILAKVLVENGTLSEGSELTKLPTTGHTTTNKNGEVLVKYDDASFYPEFVVYFK